ncbi:acyl-CoA desaturase [Gloeobacter kilaueensis]|uniref:Stearoyl-CoA 9-desaturase n=1 Tax=Gloeobacter kilaueensis (strain ATCC BAA-2537 / CCAP 1431/1 / ULC 316 / JS1) TaxID=1183438 RepID=U5QME2_GLOK1|nr:fatty acid desaturase [Gloeobacter kilaueensis]AGY58779.1 stearoyl-CoA 9-desaturase [Gloeobacter kilaueensis JS1]
MKTHSSALSGLASLKWPLVGFIGTVHLLALLAPWCFSWSALGVALLLHWLLGGIGICLGYHRLLAHRSFRLPQLLERAVALLGALALQGGPIFWVAGHRRHHAWTEDPTRDPHASTRGFWWSHLLWLVQPQAQPPAEKFAADLACQPFYRWLERYHLLLQLPFGLLLFLLGGVPFVVYGIFVRTVLLWHTTWLVNSAAHLSGYRSYQTADCSRNLWWVALLTYGEGWHNNHHAHPRAARAGLLWWEVDLTWGTIRLLEMVGLARKVVRPSCLVNCESVTSKVRG